MLYNVLPKQKYLTIPSKCPILASYFYSEQQNLFAQVTRRDETEETGADCKSIV